MLVLSRKVGERIHVGDDITIEVRRIAGNRVTIALAAPRDVRILRGELERAVREFRPSEDAHDHHDQPVDAEHAAAGAAAVPVPHDRRVTFLNGLATPTVGRDFAI